MSLRWGNESLFDTIEKELPQSTFYWLMISICLAISWVVYITYYNSRVLGLILTTILNHFIKHGHIKFGSFSISVLSGKIMFRDMQWITEDYSVRVQLGLAIFRWWRPLTLKEITEDLSHSETRLSVYLDSFEWHIYNRSTVYAELESLFGLEPHIKQQHQKQQQPETNTETSVSGPGGVESKWQWRDLIPVIKFDISSGRIVFGNYHMSTTLSANFGDTHMVYTTKPASTPFDQFMHVLTCKMENLRVMFVPSPDSKAPEDEPPRFMGDGFVVLHSNNADIYYYHDEPGLVPYEPEMVELANGDVVARRTWPCWGMDVKCGKGTDISYGPWADRQREKLHRFFFPQNYQPLEATTLPSPGEIRMYKCFDFKMSVQAECTIDILFTKDKETQAIHMNTQAGSYLDATVPYVLENDGYTTKVNGQLMNVDATSSLQFRSFLECETLQFDIETVYPKYWNDHQKWRLDLTACKSSLYLIFDHKYFFADLVNDWSSKSRDDLYHFVPYTWQVCFLLKQFEIITLVNEYNWIDCFGKTPENAHIAVRGDTLDVSFVLPFIDFLPPTVSLPITFKGEFAVLSLYLPEKNTSRHALLSIARTMKIVGRDGKELSQPFGSAESQGKWMRTTDKSIGWVDCMEAPSVAVNLNYMYHPMALLEAEDSDSNQGEPTSTLSSEEKVLNMPHLIPLRPLRPRKKQPSGMSIDEFDASQMEADVIFVDVEIAPSVLCAYGSLIGNILHLKENYLGEDSKFTDYEASAATKENSIFEHINSVTTKLETFDPRVYRPLEVKVEVTLHDIQAHLVKNCKRDDPPCPWIFIERLSVEVNKNYEETKVQVLVAPAFLLASDKIKRPLPHAHLQDGHMRLSGLQIRGHAMFSHEGLPIDSETLEYAWLVEVTVGELTGRVTAPQLQMIVECLEELVFLVEDAENSLQRPDVSQQLCHHRVSQTACTQSLGFPCPSSDDLRYTMTRVTVDGISLYLVEAGSALSLQLYPIRLSTCNLHGKNNKAGITVLIPHIKVKQFVLSLPTMNQYNSDTDLWLESGSVSLGPITVNSAMALEYPELRHIQDTFLKRYDRRSCRLNFLWPPEDGATLTGKCGCVGGCSFFGNNRNGTTVFQPSNYDSQHGLNSVMYHRVDDEAETTLGFGQSILHAGRFIFYTPDIPSSEDTLKVSHHSGDLADGDTARSSITLVEQESAKSLLCLSESPGGSTGIMSEDNFTTETGTNADKELAEEPHRHSSHVVDGRIYRDKLKSMMLPADRPLSDGLRESWDMGSVFDTDFSSPNTQYMSTPRVLNIGDGDGFSHELVSSGLTPRQGALSNGSPASVCRHDSFSSIHSLTTSHQSSIVSPVLQRLSSKTSIQKGSSPSVTGSEKYFSCTEDADVLSNCGNDSISALSDYQGASPGSQSTGESFWFSRDDDPVTHTVIMTSRDSDGDSSDDSGSSFVSAASSNTAHRRRSRKGASQYHGVNMIRGQSNVSESHLVSESDDITPLLNETPTQESPHVADYVNLHNQISQPITRSPILISSYVGHMTQLRCAHWMAVAPVPHLLSNTSNHSDKRFLSSASTVVPPSAQNTSSLTPRFVVVQPGFTSVKMTARKEASFFSRMANDSVDSKQDVNREMGGLPGTADDLSEIDGFMTTEDSISNTTAVVNLKGPIDVMISPLLLETLQRYVEAVTPALSTLHVSSVVDLLHRRVSAATSHNEVLEGDDMDKDTSLDDIKGTKQGKGACSQCGVQKVALNQVSSEQGNRTSRVQVMFSISKVNIRMLQMSLVEEVVSFSALDRIKELMCVSVFCACLDSITFTLLANNQLEKSADPKMTVDATPGKHHGEPMDADRRRGSKKVTPLTCPLREKQLNGGTDAQNSEQIVKLQKEDSVGSLNIARIHFQLRRLKQKTNMSHMILTTIPEHRSKVTFTFPSDEPGTNEVDELTGFIMFECGLEDISLKGMWRSGYSPTPTMEDSLHLQQAETLLHDVQRKVTFYNEASEDLSEDLAAERVQRQQSDPPTKQTAGEAENQRSEDNNCSAEAEQMDGEDEVDGPGKLEMLCAPLEGNASSCVLQFQTVWFNFAAPPSKRRNTESSRLDWNLLSTATPAIKAWMNPAHHLTVAATDLLKKYKYRLNTVMACIMIEALEVQGIHVPAKGKFNRLTSRSRALQVDPSCQLMTVLRRYLAQVDLADIEASINSNSIPQFITIQKGLLALTRQWKNVLYLPCWVDNSFRRAEKLPYTYAFAIPPDPATDVMKDDVVIEADTTIVDDGIDTISDSFEVVDENMSLLKAEGGSFHTAQSAVQEFVPRAQHQTAAAEKGHSRSGPCDQQVKYMASGTAKLLPTSSNPVMPLPSTKETLVALSEPQQGRATMGMRLGSFLGVTSLQSHLTRNESYISVLSVCSGSGGSSVDGIITDPATGRASFAQHLSRLDQRTEETDDLYRWMQRQQDFTKTAYYPSTAGMPETFTKNKGSEQSIDELPSEHPLPATLVPMAFQPVAAQVLFKPLLTTLGLHIDAVKRSALMKKFGGNVSIKGALNALRIDIIESEEVVWTPRRTGKAGYSRSRSKTSTRKTAHFNVDPTTTTPALLFDNFTITAAMKDNIDLQKVVPVPASMPNRNVGRQSIHSVKLAMDHMEAKPTTTKVYFDVYCHGITQHVNVPLLRLVHQFVTMIETVNDTHQQLREVSSLSKENDYRCHVKSDSKGSSSSTETTSPSVQSGTPVGSSLSPQYSEGAHVDSIISQPQRPDQLSLQSPGGKSAPKSSYPSSKMESGVHSPLHSYAESVMVASGELSSPAVAERTIVDEITENTPKCWHTLYHLLELYSIMPETNAIDPQSSRSRLSVIDEESDCTPVVTSEWKENRTDSLEQLERQVEMKRTPRRNTITRSMFMQSVLIGERVPLIIFGTAKVKRVRISAFLSGLKLEAEIRNVHASATHKERVKGAMKKKSHESSVTAHVGHSMIVMREGVPPDMQTVVTVNIGQSQGLYSAFYKEAKEHNSGILTIGVIDIDIPQHPVALHGVVYRSSKRLSTTLQEFIRPPGKVRTQESEGNLLSQQASRHSELSEHTSNTTVPSLVLKLPQKTTDNKLTAPSVVHFKAVLQGLVLGASLLPSLRARYKMEEVQCTGVTGIKPKCTVDLPAHSLSFTSRVTIPSSLPSSASINLPPVHIHGDYLQHNVASTLPDSGGLMEGHHLRAGHYLHATADVGVFEHSLTTDLLNHLVFVQKVFMKEVNELVQKVSGGDQPVSIFGDLSPKSNMASRIEPLLYSISLRLKGIQITATTPSSIAVRLETSVIDLDLTNRVVNNRYCATDGSGTTYVEPSGSSHKLFVKMQVDLNLALGTLLKNPMFEEAEAEFQHLASFATRFGLRNALQDEMIPDMNKDQEALLISLTRPVIYIQPVSFDKAVLVWLNYKNAYEYWNEQRAALNKEVQTATMQVIEKFPLTSHAPATPTVEPATNSTLFLQVTASDMGMCLPLNSYISPGVRMIDEPTAATVMTLESTQISVCSFGSMVSKGRFQGFCLRFADDFEVSWDDWKPEKNQDVVMNAMVVPEGTYEICSRTMTVAPGNTKKNIKWMMNVNWKMQGLDVHLDTNIGQRLSMLGSTLTSLAREQSDDNDGSQSESLPKEEETTPATRVTSYSEDLPRFLFDNTVDKKTRARLIVDAMNKQAKKVEELRSSTASQLLIEPEERKLNVLETAVFNDFRQDIMKRLNRQVTRATTIKEKLGLGYKPVHHRSKSVGTNVLRELKKSDSDITESTRHASYTGILRDQQESMSFDINAVATNQRHGRTLSLDTNSLELPLKSLDSVPSQMHSDFTHHSLRRSSLATPSSSESFSYEGREVGENGECSLPSSLGQGTSSSEDLDMFNQEHLAILAERFGTDRAGIPTTYGDTHTSQKRAPVAEPNIDFELDIKLDVDCGKCVLHSKELETEGKSGNGKRRDSFSPRVRRRNVIGKKPSAGDIPTIKIHPTTVPTNNSTVFILPGVDIRVHYSSKMNHDTPSPDTVYTGLASSRTPVKKANLYIWLTLQQQFSQEMLISPVLLDFMEQALEPIPLPVNKASSATTSRASESNAINTSASSLVATYSSFPVDIIVYFQMESSIVRFTCLPDSRVECLVRLPSLSLVFSTKRSIADDNFNSASSTDGGASNDGFSSGGIPDVGRTRRVSGYHTEVTSGGGLSVTGCLNNFSMFIFHPYGGMAKKTSFTALETTFHKAATGTSRQTMFDATGRKDALSLNVEFIKVNVSRSRKAIIHSDWTPGATTGSTNVRSHDTPGTKSHNIVRFSAICDVGFASFNYDMRRLSEILAFPKAWYSRTLARHLFLGEEMGFGVDSMLSDDDNDVIPSFLVTPSTPHGRAQNLMNERFPVDGSMHSLMSRSPGLSPWRTTSTSSANRAPSTGDASPRPSRESSLAGLLAAPHTLSKPIMQWETLVIFAVNLSRLDLTINMSNIMGNTVWTTKDVKSQGELSIDSSGHKNMKILAGLGESKLEAQGGIVGCKIEVQNLWTNLKIKEDPGKEPYHKVGLQLQIIETRLDYMGSSMMMGRMCNLDIVLKDEWRLDRGGSGDDDLQPLATKRPVLIFMHGDLSWDLMHLMISRSTTPDLLRMFTKLDEFFRLHIKSSAHVLSSLGPMQKPKPSKRKSDLSDKWISRMRHHRHWQKVLSNISGCKLSMFDFTLPTEGTIAGGTMMLRGNSFSLACFHGINFRCKSWALFTMDEPIVHFATESQEIINDDGETCAHIVQNLSFQLGHNMADLTERKHMATVCLLNRGHHVPPHFTSVQEWFHYAFATNELKDLNHFPEMSHEDGTGPQMSPSSASMTLERRRRQQELNHDTEIIFVLPSLQMNFKTIHQQGVEEPREGDPKPLVECSFVTEFEDHTYITMDAESILFIHDLVTSYLREKDKDGSESGLKSPSCVVESPTEVLKQDYREYQCHTWHLEPTIRLISWGGKKIDPVGVDYILQKLGFQHARLTIPKWIQRGFMDPLDGILSVLVKQLIKSLKEEQTQSIDGQESDIM